MIGYYDVMIAATAIEHGFPVATFNLKHFQSVPGLTVIDPST
jgi:predicted nucleic acid-binding protein